MSTRRLDNYLKTYRKRAGLDQRDIAHLLGWKDATHISRLENQSRVPSLQIAIGLAVALNTPVSELFAGIHDRFAAAIGKRRTRLIKEFESAQVPASRARQHAHKLKWLKKVEENATQKHDEIT